MRVALRAAFVSAVLIVGSPTLADDVLDLEVTPEYGFAPVTLRMRVDVEPQAENRLLEVEADSMEFYRRSDVVLDADRAPRRFVITFPNVPAGIYTVRAYVFDSSGNATAMIQRKATVLE